MPAPTNHRLALTPEERRKCRVPVAQAAEIKGISEDAFKQHYAHLIEQTTPRRLTVKLGDVLDD
jgi:hypothetical protein